MLKKCSFEVTGKGQFKDEFVTAGGVPLSEVTLNTMEGRIRPHLYFAGENAWSGGYIAGTSKGKRASENLLPRDDIGIDEPHKVVAG